MKIPRRALAVAAAAAVALVPSALAAGPAQATTPGTTSLASVLLADTSGGAPSFDGNGRDFDILTAAVLTVLKDDPTSPVSVLADGNVALTAFIPTDAAFRRTGEALGLTASTEKGLATKYVNALGVAGIESVLLYHVVPGATIDSTTAAASDGAVLTSALGQTITVKLNPGGIFLRDQVTGVINPRVTIPDINAGNKQIAHGIGRVLLPAL
jgi:uncharacterized surface protein with fasciclin (FAS1) repeats